MAIISCAGKDGEPEFVDRAPGFPKTGSDWPVTPEAFCYESDFWTELPSAAALYYRNGMSAMTTSVQMAGA